VSSGALCSRRVLVTGANGFIGKNLVVRLNEVSNVRVATFVRGDDPADLPRLVSTADIIVHLAGENRPQDAAAFVEVNARLTSTLCAAVEHEFNSSGRHVPLLLASSTQAEFDNPYGRSKLEAEGAVRALSAKTHNPCIIFRLPGVFGKWSRPNYNSVVATFCYNIARDLPIRVTDPSAILPLIYIDDVVTAFLAAMDAPQRGSRFANLGPIYSVSLGELAAQIQAFRDCRTTLLMPRVGVGFVRALYATYVSYLPKEKFTYRVPQYVDKRGAFVEMLKSADTGQFSYFTAHPGVTRGGHYHHTKTEKFLVIKGEALFRFRHLLTSEFFELRTSGLAPEVVDTVPGWTHDITNVGVEELVVMLWANENFDREKPDTVASKV
jgi:UDP-2-acetamido-2,6-beta-L-arabino-hexul-4-ose reductase